MNKRPTENKNPYLSAQENDAIDRSQKAVNKTLTKANVIKVTLPLYHQ